MSKSNTSRGDASSALEIRMREVAAHRLAGRTQAETAELAGLSRSTVARYEADDAYSGILSEIARADIRGIALSVFRDVRDSIQKLRELRDCGNPNVELGAVNTMMKMAPQWLDYLGIDLHPDTSAQVDVTIKSDMTDEERREIFKQLRRAE